MTKTVLAVFLGALLPVSAVLADPIPPYMLDKDFTSCMGGENPQQDTQRRDYCLCVRDSMKDWTLEEYGQTAMEESKAHSAAQEPAKLQALAQACIAKVMH
jgi:hypothetical protein